MKLICLNSGTNGSGMTAAVVVETTLPNAMRSAVFPLCLVNAGDSIQRFCMDGNVKLSKLQFIVITSLSPHCISGLPGLILGLSGIGLEQLTVIGPLGLGSYVNSTRAFANRAYPVCKCVELVDTIERMFEFPLTAMGDISRSLCTQKLTARCRGVCCVQTGAVIGACFSVHIDTGNITGSNIISNVLVGIFPVSFGTTVLPKLEESLRWAHSKSPSLSLSQSVSKYRHSDADVSRLPCALFIPLECLSSNTNPLHSRTWMAVADVCLADPQLDCGVFADGCLRSDVIEFRTAQKNNLLFHSIAPQMFPFALQSVQDTVEKARTSQSVSSSSSCGSEDEVAGSSSDEPVNSCDDVELNLSGRPNHRGDVCCRVFRAVPLLTVPLRACHGSSCGEVVSWQRTEGEIVASFTRSVEKLSAPAVSVNKISPSDTTTTNVFPAEAAATIDGNRIAALDIKVQLLNRKRKSENEVECELSEVVSRLPPPPTLPPPSLSPFSMPRPPPLNPPLPRGPPPPMEVVRPPPPPCSFPDGKPPVTGAPGIPQCLSSNSNSISPDSFNSNMTVTFLGTGSASPSKHRNNTSIMLRECSDGTPRTLLLDVGEGTSVQLFYHCSKAIGDSNPDSSTNMESTVQLYWSYLRSIEIIWISHHHGDHLSGLLMLVEQVRRAWLNVPQAQGQHNALRSNKILLIGSTIVLQYAEPVLRAVGLLEFVNCYHIGLSTVNNRDEANFLCDQCVAAATGGWLRSLVSIPVVHCPMAFAVVLVFYNGRKIVYSGDCRPPLTDQNTNVGDGRSGSGTDNRVFAKHAMHCDLLIHESTFEDVMQGDAISKRHSTISEALVVSRLVRAKALVLTHFSQRYPKMVDIAGSTNAMAATGSDNVSNALVAFDLMTISMPFSCNSSRSTSGVDCAVASIEKLLFALTQLEIMTEVSEVSDDSCNY